MSYEGTPRNHLLGQAKSELRRIVSQARSTTQQEQLAPFSGIKEHMAPADFFALFQKSGYMIDLYKTVLQKVLGPQESVPLDSLITGISFSAMTHFFLAVTEARRGNFVVIGDGVHKIHSVLLGRTVEKKDLPRGLILNRKAKILGIIRNTSAVTNSDHQMHPFRTDLQTLAGLYEHTPRLVFVTPRQRQQGRSLVPGLTITHVSLPFGRGELTQFVSGFKTYAPTDDDATIEDLFRRKQEQIDRAIVFRKRDLARYTPQGYREYLAKQGL